MHRVRSSVVAGGGRARWTEALPHLVPHAGQATYIKPRMPSGGVLHGLQARSYLGSAKDVGRGCRGLPGDGAEREQAGWSRVSRPSSLLSLGRCSGGGALRLRTFHSSLHTPSSGQPLIGYTWSDVTASFLFPHPPAFPCPSLSLPRPVRGMQLGCPSPREWDPMSSCESSAFCCLIYYPPATSVIHCQLRFRWPPSSSSVSYIFHLGSMVHCTRTSAQR